MTKIDSVLAMSDRAKAYYELVKYYKYASAEERNMIRTGWDFNREWIYPDETTLACNISNMPSCAERIEAALMYDSIENFKFDKRDSLIGICIVYHSALEAGINVVQLFKDVAKISDQDVSNTLISFLERNEKDKSLKAFGLKKIVDECGIRIIRDPK
jgi:hypothetical protein